eukprot:4247291-Karenia_brevis.AAC.1
MNVSLEQDWHDRFATEKHNDLSLAPEYLVRDGFVAEGISGGEKWLQHLPDLYGYRGYNPLNP